MLPREVLTSQGEVPASGFRLVLLHSPLAETACPVEWRRAHQGVMLCGRDEEGLHR